MSYYIRGILSGLWYNTEWDKFVEFEKSTPIYYKAKIRTSVRASKVEPCEIVEVWVKE